MRTTLLLDLMVLGCGKGLVPLRSALDTFQMVLEKHRPAIVVTSAHRCFNSESEMAVVFDLPYRELVIGHTDYAWIRVPLIEEQEIASYVIHHPERAPFVVVGPIGPPDRLSGRGVLWCNTVSMFGDFQLDLLDRLCSASTAE